MHHRPSGPPLSVRLTASVRRAGLLLRRWLRHHGRRVGMGIAVTVAVTAALLAVPVTVSAPEPVSVPETSTVALAPSSRPSSAGSPSAGSPSAGSPSAGSSAAGSSSTGSPSATSSAGPSSAGSSTSALPSPSPLATPPGAGPPSSAAAPPPAPADPGTPLPPSATPPAATSPGGGTSTPTTTRRSPAAATTAGGTTPPVAPPATTAAVPPAATGVEAQVLELTNAARAEAGCRPLVADAGLAGVARAHSADMRDRDFFHHRNPAGQGPSDRASAAGLDARAENIARGQREAADVLARWMDSPGHRANILDCRLTSVGVGVVTGAGGPWWTQLFG